jgi:wyosine [tRNA(Phe)-imidazoG37] synthetase (radical SAM superfamily)
MEASIAFGPVPSRRLGRSLGINNVLPKVCSYSCVYCQLGRTIKMRAERQEFYPPKDLAQAVREQVDRVRDSGEEIDYLTFVPDGEPTLDINLGREIELLRPLGIPVAVISNSSLMWREDVRSELLKADWVSLKVDSMKEDVWRRIDRPHGSLALNAILEGIEEFAPTFDGQLVTETMLVHGFNDQREQLTEVAQFVSGLQPCVAYLSVPTRPPAEDWVQPSAEEDLNQAFQILSERLDRVEYLVGYEGDAFASTGDARQDLLSITAVHPMRREAVAKLLSRTKADWGVVEELVEGGLLVETRYGGNVFYVRRFGQMGTPTNR